MDRRESLAINNAPVLDDHADFPEITYILEGIAIKDKDVSDLAGRLLLPIGLNRAKFFGVGPCSPTPRRLSSINYYLHKVFEWYLNFLGPR